MKNNIILIIVLFVTICSCTPDVEDFQNSGSDSNISGNSGLITDLTIPSYFNFETTRKVDIEVVVNSIKDEALPGVKVSFFTEHPDFEGKYLTSAFTNSTGTLRTEIQVPTYLENLFIQVHSPGFANQKTVAINPYINLEFGGIPDQRTVRSSNKTSTDIIPISDNYYYMGNFNTGNGNGLPLYLESDADDLSQEFLNGVNASLPENKPVPSYNPQYLTTGNELDVVVIENSDVWVTFVTEGAGYRNALGYYVFDSQNPPDNVNEIDSIYIVLPNASLANSGGELYAGDKINLGTFEAGKTISWVLFQNAWTGTGVNVNATKFYSRIDFNTSETDPSKRQHTVQLADFGRQLLLNGFEDQTRSAGSDNDFNDLVFYITANPWEGIEIGGIPIVTPDTDNDGDGISNESDDFPDDPLRAIRNTYTGALAFEDLWPSRGDYDFNDLVVDYEIDHILNGDNLLIGIEADWTIKAVFAGYKNGFGVQLKDLSVNDITNVSGLNLSENIITLNGNGTEANQENATIIFFDNVFNVVQASGSPYPHTNPATTLSSIINLSNPVSQSTVGFPPYNAFIFVNGDRNVEVHLPGQEPTNLANEELFGTFADASDFEINYYYKTSNGLPWAINIPESFDFPLEASPINEAYYNFSIWATSGGNISKDWYRDLPGYRNPSKIYE